LQYTAFLEASRKGRVPVGFSTWGSNSIRDVSASTSQYFSGTPDDLVRDEEVIRGIEQADGQTDPDKRKAMWQKVHERIAAEVYWVPLYAYAKNYAFSKDLDFKPTSDEIPHFFAAKWR
jgi:peptide/nickel transport system substrate-binding protein